MEAAEVALVGGDGSEDTHVPKEPVLLKEGMCHPHPVGLHRVSISVVEVAHRRVVEVAHLPLRCVRPHRRQRATASAGAGHVHVAVRCP